VKSCEQVAGDGPGPGARYRAKHQPTRLKPAADIEVEITEFEPPRRVRLREEDDDGIFDVTYLLEAAGEGTHFTQRSDVEWKLPRLLAAIGDRMVPRHLDGQMKALKRELEGS
jgi:Polyketide cyclase / dehydrase and lipid transport